MDATRYKNVASTTKLREPIFQDIAVEFYDLILENDHPTALLGCRGNYDIAVQIDEVTGTMTGWHWFK